MKMFEYYSDELERTLLLMDRLWAEKIILEASQSENSVDVVGKIISQSLKNIGDAWENGRLSLSQVYMSGIICEELIDKVLPVKQNVKLKQPKIAIGVFEDYHMLGKRIVSSTLRATGFEIIDLGGGLKNDQLIEIVDREKIQLLLLSVLMLPSALHIKELSEKLDKNKVKLVVGGAPFRFDDKLWKEVGADAYGNDPSDAITIVSKMVEEIL